MLDNALGFLDSGQGGVVDGKGRKQQASGTIRPQGIPHDVGAQVHDRSEGERKLRAARGGDLFQRVHLGHPVPMNRVNVQLHPGDSALVGQYTGPRLPEGATQLPEGARILWLRVDVR